MSRLPHPISITTNNNKRRLNSLLEIPFPANSHCQYRRWKNGSTNHYIMTTHIIDHGNDIIKLPNGLNTYIKH